MHFSFTEINHEQKQPLDYKIEKAVQAIASGFAVSRQNCAIAFSGGKDSTVLWHLIRTYFPDQKYKIIFGNTGVEFPESLAFARRLGQEWGGIDFYEATPERTECDGFKYQAQKEILEYLVDNGLVETVLKANGKLKSTEALEKACPAQMYEDFKSRNLIWAKGTQKNYWWCVDQYGYPILGKALSGKLTARRINIDCFLRFSSSESQDPDLLAYYKLLSKVKISNHCCSILKKEPSEKLQAALHVDVIFKGLMASESQMRNLNFSTRGYLFKSSRPHCGDFYHCQPLAIWTDADIWEYIHKYNVPYSELYDLTYTNGKGEICNIKRNGCVGCATDIAFKDNHMASLRQTHPKLWVGYMLKTGLGDEIMKLHQVKNGGKLSKMDFYQKAEQMAALSPCAFDNPTLEQDEITMSEYDSEVS